MNKPITIERIVLLILSIALIYTQWGIVALPWILAGIFAILLGLCTWGILRLKAKIEVYEQYISDMKDRYSIAYEIMKQADIRGSFEADDEVGSAFKIIKQAVDNLNDLVRDEEETNA